jgi:hypothetical protein
MRKGTVILQGCTVSLEIYQILPDNLCSSVRKQIQHRLVMHMDLSGVEEDSGVAIKVEEIPEPILFPPIKAEPAEVSYLSVCPLLDTCHQYPLMFSIFHDLHLLHLFR